MVRRPNWRGDFRVNISLNRLGRNGRLSPAPRHDGAKQRWYSRTPASAERCRTPESAELQQRRNDKLAAQDVQGAQQIVGGDEG